MGLKQQVFISHSAEAGSLKSRCQQVGFPEASVLGLYLVFFHLCPQVDFLLCIPVSPFSTETSLD